MSSIQRAKELLFPQNGQWVRDIKFLSVGEHRRSSEELAAFLIEAEEQIQSGKATPIELDI